VFEVSTGVGRPEEHRLWLGDGSCEENVSPAAAQECAEAHVRIHHARFELEVPHG
jgi:hypothetical protein